MTCKDCVHYDLCRSCSRIQLGWHGNSVHYVENIEEICKDFKDRSRFVELPCKVGDTVYSVHGHPDYGYKIEALQAQDVALICSSGELSYSKRLNYFGKTVFLTREEAEQALKERET